MKLTFLSAAIAVCILSGCSSKGVRRQSPPQASQAPSITSNPLVSSTPAPIPSPASSIDIERQKAREIVKRLDQMELKFKEDQEKLDQERRENKLCRSKQALADFSPNDKEELSAECKKRLADLDKGASKTH
jgi:PBP1b-binding outer membrane lipoprotein LpoB